MFRSKVYKSSAILRSAFAYTLNEEDLKSFGKLFQRKKVLERQEIVREGEPIHTFYILEKGRISISRDGHVLAELEEGDCMGENMFLINDTQLAYPVTMKTTKDCEVLCLTRESLQEHIQQHPTFKSKLSNIVLTKQATVVPALQQMGLYTSSTLDIFTCILRYVNLDENHWLFKQGAPGDSMYMVCIGNIDIIIKRPKEVGEDEDMVVARYGPKQYFGEFTLVLATCRMASARASQKSLLLRLTTDDFHRFLTLSGEMASKFDRATKQRLAMDLKRYQVPFLAKFSDEQFSQLAQLSTITYIEPGAVFFAEGDEGDKFYIVVYGEVQVSQKGNVLCCLGPGSYFGEIALVRNTTRTATVMALKNGVMLSFSKAHFDDLFQSNPSLQADFNLRLCPQDMTMQELMHHTVALKYFTRHLESEYTKENLEFVKAVAEFKELGDGGAPQVAAAKRVFSQHIEPGCPDPINISATASSRLKKRMSASEINQDLFNECLVEIMKLLSNNSLIRFKQSSYFTSMLDELGQYKI